MSEKVSGCRADVRSCSAEDRTIAEASSRDNVARSGEILPPHLTPNGPTRREVKQAHATATAEVKELAEGFAGELWKEATAGPVVTRHVDGLLEKFCGVAGRAYSGVKLVIFAHRMIVEHARNTAVELDHAARRDAMNLVVLDLVGSELDSRYVAAQRRERDGSVEIAKGIFTQLDKLPAPRLLSVIKGLKQSARDGVAHAERLELRSREGLTRALANDARLAQRYEAETAFRFAVDSVVFTATERE